MREDTCAEGAMDSWNKGNELVVKGADQVVAKRVAGKIKPLDRVGSQWARRAVRPHHPVLLPRTLAARVG